MNVAQLKEYLSNLPDDCEVEIESHFDIRRPMTLRTVSGNMARIVLSDGIIVNRPSIMEIDGEEYEILWAR
jgi:hypothetical protein